jgi:UDP-glucuronate 4-epimerase
MTPRGNFRNQSKRSAIVTRPILLTGAAGLIGRAVRQRLEARGEDVIAVDRLQGNGITVFDLTEVHQLHEIARRGIGSIIHSGAISGPMVAMDNPHLIVQSNIVGTANILEIARISKVRRVVFLSSVSAFGNTPEGLDLVPEDVSPMPTSVYGASKAMGEHLVNAYAIQHGIDGVSVRPAWVYGPHRTTDCAIRTMIEDALDGRTSRFAFGRDFFKQYVHVDDIADAVIAAHDAPSLPRRSYTLTGASYATLGEVGETVQRVLPQARIEMADGKDPFDDVQARFDISAAHRDLGYQPHYTLESGIRSYADWIAAQR